MQLLTTTRVYDISRDNSDANFLALVQNPPEGFIVLDGNAGLGADWPAGVWKSLNGAAIALAIISAPSTIEENFPRWKEIFDAISQQVIEFHGEFRVDRDTAQVLAMNHAVSVSGFTPNRLEMHMAIRHFFSTWGGYEDLLEVERVDMDWPEKAEPGSPEFSHAIKSNEEAAKQARCRYIFGVHDESNCATIVVNQDGSIAYVADFDMQSEWG